MAEHYSRPWLCPPTLGVRAPTASEAREAAALWLAGMPDFAAAFGPASARALDAVCAHIAHELTDLPMIGAAFYSGQVLGVCRLARYPGRGRAWWREVRAYAGVLGWRTALGGMRRLRAWGWSRDVQPDELYLYGWFVRAAWRGRGIGRALMVYAQERTRLLGLEKLVADVRQDDLAARAILAHFGFDEMRVYRAPRQAHPGLVRLRCVVR